MNGQILFFFYHFKILGKVLQYRKLKIELSKLFLEFSIYLEFTPLLVVLQVGDDGNVCTSVVEFNPKKEDDQKFLSCQARNELIDDIAVEDQWKITVYCKFINVLYISSFKTTTHY